METYNRPFASRLVLGAIFATTAIAFAASQSAFGEPAAAAGDSLETWLAQPRASRPDLAGQAFAQKPLSKADAEHARKLLWDDHVADIKESRAKEWTDEAITIGAHTLKLKEKHFGDKPAGGWNLFISMHGGGGAPKEVNDQQWDNQIKLYQPKDSLYVCPRAPTDTWNLWHEAHMDGLFDRLIEDAIVLGDVNPNRVYIMGYSAGGDGVYQLAPRMADRWAAASMMAGHPNDASPIGLRNIGFTMHVGALDAAYKRNQVILDWKKQLDDLQEADPMGYTHSVWLHAGREHWMNLEDAVAVDWMQRFTREPLPPKVAWKQSSVTHDRFYWLAVPEKTATKGALVIASRNHQVIDIEKIEGIDKLRILLNDQMVDLDRPVVVRMEGTELLKGIVPRTVKSLEATTIDRGDPDLVFDADVLVQIPEKK